MLHIHRRYEFQLVDNPFQWVLTTSTIIEEDTDNTIDLSLSYPIFMPYTEFGKYVGTTTNLDIIGILIDKSLPRTVNTQLCPAAVQDLVLISQDKIPVILSLWNDFITTEGAIAIAPVGKFPIIVVLKARVQSFRGTSLSAKGFSTVLDEPPFPKTKLYANGKHFSKLT